MSEKKNWKLKETWKEHKKEIVVNCIVGAAACIVGYEIAKLRISNKATDVFNEYGDEFVGKLKSMADVSNHAITAFSGSMTTMKDVDFKLLSENFPNGLDPDMKANGLVVFCTKEK